MFSPTLITTIKDNDPKGESNSTVYEVQVVLNKHPSVTLTYTLLDQINVTKEYKTYLEYYSFFKEELKEFEDYQKESLKELVQQKKQERLQENSISDSTIQYIKDNLPQFDSLILEYKSGKDKALNSLVGKYLKLFKQNNQSIDPLVLKETLIQIL